VSTSDKFRAALAGIDAANALDPNETLVRGERRPKELAHGELAAAWIERLVDAPSEALQLAARGHHIRRWQSPRSDYPDGRAGYHRWRRELQGFHAAQVGVILEAVGYAEPLIVRVQTIIKKQGLGRDPEVQALEDALCLVFLELQFHDLAERLEEEKLLDVTRKTLAKMSPAAVALAGELPLEPADIALIERANTALIERAGAG
jgi:hypothetical protein